jgi:metal-sulfur cluster biosynthetic enzyme
MSKDFENSSENPVNEIRWALHDTNPELVENMRTKLSEVVDPEIGMNIIQLGLVRDFSLENETGHLKMVLTTPFCPYGPAMIEMTRQKAEEALEKPVIVEMVPDVWDFSYMEDPSALDWGF